MKLLPVNTGIKYNFESNSQHQKGHIDPPTPVNTGIKYNFESNSQLEAIKAQSEVACEYRHKIQF